MTVGKDRTLRAVRIRDHVLPLIQKHGSTEIDEVSSGLKSVSISWQVDDFSFSLRTPLTIALKCSKSLVDEWGLDIWKFGEHKRLNMVWNNSELEVVSFRPGDWEAQVLAL